MRTFNSSLLNSINTGYRAIYLKNHDLQVSVAAQLAQNLVSTNLKEAYAIVGITPKMREWIGERVVKNLTASIFEITNKRYEATIEVDVDDLEDDKAGIYEPQIASMGAEAALIWDDIFNAALVAGTTTICHDGQYYFDVDHPVDQFNASSAVQSNLFASRPLTAANLAYVRTQMASWRIGPDGGRSLRVRPSKLMVGPDLEYVAKEILQSDTLSDGAGAQKKNVLAGSLELVINPDQTAGTWYIFDTSGAERSIVIAKRKQPQFIAKDDPKDSSVFWRRKLHYGTDARGGAGYGPWWLGAMAKAGA